MFKQKIDNKFSEKTLIILSVASFLLLIIASVFVIYLLELSNYGGTLEKTQLGFDGEYLKEQFAKMTEKERKLFIIANIVDYGFMLTYGVFFFSTALLLTRKIDQKLWWKKTGFYVALMGIGSAISDGIENIFLLIMATNPINFPNWLAYGHSTFAVIKFVFMYTCFGWITITIVLIVIRIVVKSIKKEEKEKN